MVDIIVLIYSCITSGKKEAGVRHVAGTVISNHNHEIFCYIEGEFLGAVPVFLLTPLENPVGKKDDLVSV